MTTPDLIANRYRVQNTLGKGGMAIAYRVLDTTTRRELALKQLSVRHEDERQNQVERLFEQEFYTLAQLAHPRVVEAYDFGRDEAGPFYTMELLDGGDLRDLSPLPWQRACSLLADVCSVLSLLHSRRLVYRDLNARNVRCTRDRKAKLIDFGAMVPMGPCNHAIGTPSFVAPEVVGLQELDARSDLYSLGAVLYFALTTRAAYPARNFAELPNAWRSPPRSPSHFADGIPRELDNLVLSLIDIDPVARPVNAAEVMERLSAIAGIELDEQLLVSKSYLSTPTLVGRGQETLRVRKRMLNVPRRRGATLLIEGPAGVGRTRFLNACVLEAKVAGATVLKADAGDAHAGNWAAARALATHLVDELPQLALETARPYLPVLGHMLPELIEKTARSVTPSSGDSASADVVADTGPNATEPARDTRRPGASPLLDGAARFRSWRPPPQTANAEVTLETFDDPQLLRPRLQAALCDWFLQISEKRFLMIAIDDVHGIDEPSAALIARLSNELSDKMLLLAVTANIDVPAAAPGATKLLKDASARVALKNLASKHTGQLLGSVFGNTPNVPLLADRLHRISDGNPSAIMQLAQHLVDKGVVRYGGGTWTLPNRIEAGDLPHSMAETFKAKAERLNPDARRLAQTLALTPGQSLSFEECLILSEQQDKATLLRDLNELVTFGIVSTDGQYYSLGHQGWDSPLVGDLDKETERASHLKIAEMFSLRGSNACRVAMHLFAAGQEQRGLDALVHDAERSQTHLVKNPEAFYAYIDSLPAKWPDIYKLALGLCQEHRRPRKQAFLLQMDLIRFSVVAGLEDIQILHDVVDQLVQDSGLGFYEQLGDSVDADQRVWRALEMAQQHYEATAEADRVLSPAEAIPELANAVSYVMSTASNAQDYALMEALPSLKPLEPLSPALGVVNRVVNAGLYLCSARYEQAKQETQAILDRIAQPDHAGLEDAIHKLTRFGWSLGMGMIEASYGLESSLKWADEIEQDFLHEVNAWRIRMVYYLRQGDSDKAEECKRRVEMLHVQNSPAQQFEGGNAFVELLAHGLADDLLRVKGTIDEIETAARRFRTWVPSLHFARGEYQRIRGDFRSALNEYEQALKLIAPGRHVVWPHVAAGQLMALFELGRFAEGKEIGQQHLLAAEREEIREGGTLIQMPLALLQAAVGEHEAAVRNAQAAIDRSLARGATGLNLGTAYETRAHVAILMNDHEAFAKYARLCAEQYQTGRNPALTAKYEKLVQQALRSRLRVADGLAHAADFAKRGPQAATDLAATLLTNCRGPQDRMRRALEVLVTQSDCMGGFLYTMHARGPVLCAQHGNVLPPAEMDEVAKQHLQAETDDSSDITMTVADLAATSASQLGWTNHRGEEYCPVLLGHEKEDGFCITGLAVLLPHPGKRFVLPVEAAAVVSRGLLEAGDVTAVLTGN